METRKSPHVKLLSQKKYLRLHEVVFLNSKKVYFVKLQWKCFFLDMAYVKSYLKMLFKDAVVYLDQK